LNEGSVHRKSSTYTDSTTPKERGYTSMPRAGFEHGAGVVEDLL